MDFHGRIEPFQRLAPTPHGIFSFSSSFPAATSASRLRQAPRSPSPHVQAEIGGDAVDFVHEPLARLVVIDLTDLGGPLVAVDPIEHLEERRDSLPRRRRPPRWRSASPARAWPLQFGVIRLVVDDATGERLPHDLLDPLRRDLLLAGDFVIGVALAQAGEDAASAEDPAARVKPPSFPGNRRLIAHIRLAPPPPEMAFLESRHDSPALGNRKILSGKP